jgi:hypothetical protein
MHSIIDQLTFLNNVNRTLYCVLKHIIGYIAVHNAQQKEIIFDSPHHQAGVSVGVH